MRIAHQSDLHFGDPKTLTEVERCTAFAIDAAIAHGAELAVISGDSTDHAIDVHSPSFVALARLVRRLADHCPVLILQGTFSHEPPGTLDVFRLLGGRFAVHVADRIHQVADALGRHETVQQVMETSERMSLGDRRCFAVVRKADDGLIGT